MITAQVIGSVGVSTSRQFIGAAFRIFNQPIQKLFENGEQGFFYDPNDLSTMFQDSAGTTPVTAVGQPVGIILDKSKGLVLGPELFNQVINFSTWTGVAGGTDASGNTFRSNGGAGGYFKNLTAIGVSSTKTYQVRIVGTCTVAHVIGNRSTNAGSFTVQAGDFDITVVAPLLFSGPSLYFYLMSSGTMTVNSISIKELAGNHAFQGGSASRPILRQNATTGAYYLAFDGVDDSLQTKNINFTATNKVSLFAGIRKLSDSAFGVVLETGTNYTTPTGGFALFAPFDIATSLGLGVSSGNVFYSQGYSGYNAPRNSVTSLRLDLSATDRPSQTKFNINGAWKVIEEGSAAAGIFANNPIFIGRRNGTTLPFNGHIYGLIGVGKLTTDSETLAIEKELAKQVGVTLNV